MTAEIEIMGENKTKEENGILKEIRRNATREKCCGNHLSRRQMITQMVNLLVGYQVGNSQENSTRSLC